MRLARDIRPDEVHVSLDVADSVWTLAVVTLDKPFLFSNICGVLSSFGMNILRGHALTNPNGLVLDVFQFTDDERFLELNPDAGPQVLHILQEVVSGHADVTSLLRGREQSVLQWRGSARVAPVVRADNEASGRYTILDIVAGQRARACSTGSAVSSPSTAATSTWFSFQPKGSARSTCSTSPRQGPNSPRRSSAR